MNIQNIGSFAVETIVEFQNNCITLNTNLAALRLHEVLWQEVILYQTDS